MSDLINKVCKNCGKETKHGWYLCEDCRNKGLLCRPIRSAWGRTEYEITIDTRYKWERKQDE